MFPYNSCLYFYVRCQNYKKTSKCFFLLPQGCETWVLSDYSATSSNEITVQRGQQVEVLEPSSSSTSMILVRLYGQKEEGLVPQSCLKQPTGGFKYRNARDEGKLSSTFS